MNVTLLGNPLGKPRQTQKDKWAQRPSVLAYRAWADELRYKAFRKNSKITLQQPTRITIKAYFDSGKVHRTGPHTVPPDADNVAKACLDALFMNDQVVWDIQTKKFWCDGGQPRIEIHWEEGS